MLTCETVRKGRDCPFATRNGCFFVDGHCDPIVIQCERCERIEVWPTGKYCSTCPSPEKKWINFECNYSTQNKEKIIEDKKHVDPIKASKRKMKGEGKSL